MKHISYFYSNIMESSTKNPGFINFSSHHDDSVTPVSMEIADSPVIKKRNLVEFPTEETLNLRSINSPNTATSLIETFYGKIKGAVFNNKLSETLKHIRSSSDSKIDNHEGNNAKTENKESNENIFAFAGDPHELVTTTDIPTLIWCAYCKGERKSELSYVNSSKTFWAAIAIFLSGGVAGCCLAPYCTNKCKTPQLKCSRCGHTLLTE